MTESKKLKVVYRNPNDLIPYVNNARTHSPEQVLKIASSIKEFGFNNPILIDGQNGVIAGHGRLEASKKLGLDSVPTICLEGMTDTQKKAYILADNKIALDAGWDEDLLKIELEGLKAEDFDIELTGFGADEIGKKDTDRTYSEKVDIPQYEIQGKQVELSDCVDIQKYNELISEINLASVTDEEREFLKKAACRHFAFNYSNVAEYYAGASKTMQELMEKSALVIIDKDNAIRNGYAKLKATIENEA